MRKNISNLKQSLWHAIMTSNLFLKSMTLQGGRGSGYDYGKIDTKRFLIIMSDDLKDIEEFVKKILKYIS